MATSTRPGDVLAGRYRLVDLLAESGGGRFWRAQDRMLERFVALHVLSEDDPRSEELLAAARDSATFHDSRVLRVLDAATADGLTYVVNEWGNGTSLDILLARSEPLGPRRSSWLVAEVAGAIAVAHDHGVTHGRLNPEAVLLDRLGAIRLIGLGVDAALHGIPRGDRAMDRADLGGLLYCCLTGTWPGPSASDVPPAPREHDEVLPPRRVRAGIPRSLDEIWRAIAVRPHRGRSLGHAPEVGSANAIRDRLLEFIGDPTGLPQALASSIPAINELRPVDLPAVKDPTPHPDGADLPTAAWPAAPPPREEASPPEDPGEERAGAEPPEEDPPTEEVTAAAESGPGSVDDDVPTQQTPLPGPPEAPAATDEDESDDAEDDEDLPAGVSISDLPTEAGMPVFDDDRDDVDWFRAGRTAPPPPPELKDPEPRPLFAPEPENGEPARRPREGVAQPQPARLGPMPASPAPPPPADPWEPEDTAEQPAVPGRSWFRLAMALAAALLLLVAVVVAFNLGRGRTPLGGEPDPSPSASPSATAGAPINQIEVTDFDPLGNPPEEHPTTVDRAVDGADGTTWRTSTYLQQLGPEGLKTGVGLLLDLGESYDVTSVELTLVGAPTTVDIHVGEQAPTEPPSGEPAARTTVRGQSGTVEVNDAAGQYVLVWLTALPPVPGGFRGEVAEVVVRGR